MHMLSNSVDHLARDRQASRNRTRGPSSEGNHIERRSYGYSENPTGPNVLSSCCEMKSFRCIFSCFGGFVFLGAGFICIVLYFTNSNGSHLLIPGLGLFILGVVSTSVNEWYCRSKLRRSEVERRLRREEERRARDIERAAEAAVQRFAHSGLAEELQLPPSYCVLYPGGCNRPQTLPVALTSQVRNVAVADDAVSEADTDASTARNEAAPPYSNLHTQSSSENEELPSYDEVTSNTDRYNNNAGKL